jgi:hypothetical protein
LKERRESLKVKDGAQASGRGPSDDPPKKKGKAAEGDGENEEESEKGRGSKQLAERIQYFEAKRGDEGSKPGGPDGGSHQGPILQNSFSVEKFLGKVFIFA